MYKHGFNKGLGCKQAFMREYFIQYNTLFKKEPGKTQAILGKIKKTRRIKEISRED